MTAISEVADYTIVGDVGVITVNSPPVNALSLRVRNGLAGALATAAADAKARAVVLICEGKTFIAGADLAETHLLYEGVKLRDILDTIEDLPKPVIAAIHGTALGGGLEVALCCHYRVSVPSARFGLPEVNIGILAGAGGTQRLPRIVGVETALDMVTSGRQMPSDQALKTGLVDELVAEGELRDGAIAFARKVIDERLPLRRVRDLNDRLVAARGHPEIFQAFREANARKFRGFLAPEYNIRCIEAAVNEPFDVAIQIERELFTELAEGAQSTAQVYSFFAVRRVWKIPDVPEDTGTLPVRSVGIVGAGTMGGGIAMNFANAGILVTVVEAEQDALGRGLALIRANYERTATRGGLSAAEVETRMGRIRGSLDFAALKDADLIIEAVFERMDIKKEVFAKLDAIAKPGAILATNTSYLNVDEIAQATKRPELVLGLHFFSPANVMRLLEVVRAERTSKEVVATAMKLARKIGKVGVLVGVCHGFVGNRMLAVRRREAERLVLEGAMPWDIDQAFYDFGFPMGPFAMSDLAGLDIGWVREESTSSTIREVLCEMDRRGQKTGAGFYDYDVDRNRTPSPVTEEIVKSFLARSGVAPRAFAAEEVLERCLYPMVNEGAKILEERKAIRASDIDVIWQNGYGWPAYQGGPMWWGEHVGLAKVLARMQDLQAAIGDDLAPAALLERLVAEGKRFKSVQ